MSRAQLPLNALRAFEASARHLSFTRAAIELCVTQAAVSHQVKGLEQRLGTSLFRRLPRGLALTDEGLALLPPVRDSFDRMGDVLERFAAGRVMEVLSVGVVGTFAVGWLLPRLPAFREAHPFVDLRLFTNNNRIDIAGEGLDCAVRFGDGAWHGTQAVPLFAAPMTPLCAPLVAEPVSGRVIWRPGSPGLPGPCGTASCSHWPAACDGRAVGCRSNRTGPH
jgi:LysR family transcriptional regulator of beta-lactamase